MAVHNIIVLGAGVSGLTTALLLSRDASKRVIVVAKHMPGDYDIEYCSPWQEQERATWPFLNKLAQEHPEAGVHLRTTKVYARERGETTAAEQWLASLVQKDPWFKDVVDDMQTNNVDKGERGTLQLREIPPEELGPGMRHGSQFTSACINPGVYLPWLLGQCLKNGVVFTRATQQPAEAEAEVEANADLVVNCTGLGSQTLGGVQDRTLHPVRGQVVIVANDPGALYSVSGASDGDGNDDNDDDGGGGGDDDETAYIMARGAGGGTVLGGSYQMNRSEALPDPNLAVRIMRRAVALCPGLVGEGRGIEGLDIVRHAVGLRPLREDGPRVEADRVDGLPVVHNYGHAGFGYQASFGSASAAVKLVNEALLRGGGKAKL
ncbi:D-amino-acid oxidase [Purpureocillium lavendulum]|uniref:D-amino-acid oxidase n=1 Tax=Purpureocillium lavendulum TaxID=1247861 RepID=A0AB34FEL4_9HYPO|nr:D-amino-acid oxidase [Purpureocillium lavendulum]